MNENYICNILGVIAGKDFLDLPFLLKEKEANPDSYRDIGTSEFDRAQSFRSEIPMTNSQLKEYLIRRA